LLILAVVLVMPFSAGQFAKWTSWDSVIVAVLLAVCVLLYDSPLKATAVGPVLMGLCRGFNLLLGLSIGANLFEVDWAGQPFWYLAPIAHTIYVAGFTTAARREAELSLRWQLLLGWIVAVIGVGLWMLVPWSAVGHRIMYLDPKTWYPLLVALLCFPWLRRVFASVATPQPLTVQLAIKQSIITLIFLDAAAALQFGGTTAGISVCILVIPMTVLGLRFRST
jgi:4-hydroxybenzoate polyprenyltransferase